MKMMDCSALGELVVNHEPIELIDVRSKKEFAAMHIPGARSLPLGELASSRIFQRRRLAKKRVYVISAAGHARASLATGMLRSAGCVSAIPVDGGMKDWVARGFPVRRKRFSPKIPANLSAGAALPVMAACVAVVLHEIIAATLLAAIAGLLLLKANFLSRTRGRKRAGHELTHGIKGPRMHNDTGFVERETLEHENAYAAR
jgi:rhodanese-related sulfurtransferase